MPIVCPNCATSYDVDTASLRPSGRRVRCVRCRTVWSAELSRAEQLVAAAEALAPGSPAIETAAETATAAGAHDLEAPAERFEAAAGAETDAPPEAAAIEPAAAVLGQDGGGIPDAIAAAPGPAVEVESPPTAPADPGAERPVIEAEAAEPKPSAPLDDVETAAARRYVRSAKRKGWHWPLSHLQSGILALIVIDAIIVGWRADFVRAMPQTAAFYAWTGLSVNLRGLNFDSLTTATEEHEGLPILVIGGTVVNIAGKTEDVPYLRFAVRNAARQELYYWTAVPPQTVLPPGEAVAFHTRLASPPPDAHDVLVRFVNRYDILSGTH